MSVPDTTEGSEYLTVLFCIPNTPDWRQATAALISNFTYGRAYDDRTTNITQALEIGRKVFDTMTMCDLQAELDRVATAVEVIADNTPKLYTTAELTSALYGQEGLDFEQLEALLNILGVLPGIEIDPAKYLLEWIFKAQVLSNLYAQSTAQGAIAGSLAKGLGIEGIETVIEGIGQGTDIIEGILEGTLTALPSLLALIQLFKDDQQGDNAKVLQDIYVGLGDLSLSVTNNIECGTCGQSNCKCNPEIDGPIVQEQAQGLSDCCQPEGFDTFSDYETYACEVANWIADKLLVTTKQMEQMYFRFFDDYNNLTEQSRLSVTQIYQRIAQALPEIVDPQMLFTIPNEDRTALLTNLTDRYVAFQDQVISEVPETSTIEQMISLYWTDDFGLAAADLLASLDAHKQAYFDQLDPTQLAADILANLSDAAGEALGWSSAKVGDALSLIASQGLANLKFIRNTVINGYNTTFDCVGTLCDCDEFTLGFGVHNGGDNFGSTANGGRNDLEYFAYAETVTPTTYCGPMIRCSIRNLTGWTPLYPPNEFQVSNQGGTLIYSEQEPWPDDFLGASFHIHSGDPFSVDLIREENC